MVKFGDLSCAVSGGKHCVQNFATLFKILLEMARHPAAKPLPRQSRNAEVLKARFLDAVGAEHQARSLELLDLARSSYRLRDDDNIHLGRIEAQLLAAIQEARRRLDLQSSRSNGVPVCEVLKNVIDDLDHRSQTDPVNEKTSDAFPRLKPRQLVGQPAGPGISRGKARVIHQHADLAEFKYGETLVCDAVDPNMTFIVPLASAVVERRGGMLIHGAIIAREYGLPCVTGIAEATALIKTGDELTVDGYLGIVTVGTGEI
jgi:pyruvate,water dikinase